MNKVELQTFKNDFNMDAFVMRDKIFDPFFTTKLGLGGSGLGLNIIYNLILHKLKGNIYCTSKNKGILISITIPMKELEDEL